ncbi:hypothetical protein, variant 3 [Aphanomyces astaci]|nr:hypothetical protein, variant 3 [Aphanomyces astaci]ETV72737.1 hypothetical protein, variant 3 [Aphanomyces astaci]|eukprot:XP_009837962.1 hypothetical protein, variant 3 [Aphanomyces astaci]
MANEIEKHDAIMQVFKDRELTQKQDAEHCIEVLNAKICDLHVRIESCSTLESVNDSLRLRVDELRRQLEDESKSHNDEIHAMRVDMFNHKMALEQTFRKSLQELDAQYLKKAFNAMADESKNALVANAKLKDELQMQSIGVENLMHRFKTQADQYHKMKVENEILEMGSSLRLKEISLLKASQHGIDRAVHNIKEEFAWKQSQVQSATTKLVEQCLDGRRNSRTKPKPFEACTIKPRNDVKSGNRGTWPSHHPTSNYSSSNNTNVALRNAPTKKTRKRATHSTTMQISTPRGDPSKQVL